MSEESSVQNASKVNFWLGFFTGMSLVAVLGFVVMMVIVFGGSEKVDLAAKAQEQAAAPAANQPAAPDQAAPAAGPVKPVSADDHVLGSKNAKVTVIEYTDLECPFCLRHHATSKQLVADYGNKIQYVMRHYPLSFHANAQKAAEATECAGEQGKFFEMVDKIFEANQNKEMGVDKWKSIAQELGLKTSQFDSCLDTGKYAAKIAQSANEGGAAGVEGTPATFVNGELISGAVPIEQFKAKIDALLK